MPGKWKHLYLKRVNKTHKGPSCIIVCYATGRTLKKADGPRSL